MDHDHVNRDCLWYKLLKSGIRGPICNIIRNMYCNTTSKVKYSGVFSNNFECNLGVPQGESLSPFLFNLFLNDIEAALESGGFRRVSMSDITIRTLLYADDLLLMSDSTEDLQLGIDILYDYCTRWKLNINIEKSAVVIFRKGGLLSINDHYFFGDTLLTVTNKYSYLGMLLSDRGKCDGLQKNIANCSTRALFKLYKDLHHLHNPKIHFQCELFDKIIIPICDYGCEVWGFHKVPAI